MIGLGIDLGVNLAASFIGAGIAALLATNAAMKRREKDDKEWRLERRREHLQELDSIVSRILDDTDATLHIIEEYFSSDGGRSRPLMHWRWPEFRHERIAHQLGRLHSWRNVIDTAFGKREAKELYRLNSKLRFMALLLQRSNFALLAVELEPSFRLDQQQLAGTVGGHLGRKQFMSALTDYMRIRSDLVKVPAFNWNTNSGRAREYDRLYRKLLDRLELEGTC